MTFGLESCLSGGRAPSALLPRSPHSASRGPGPSLPWTLPKIDAAPPQGGRNHRKRFETTSRGHSPSPGGSEQTRSHRGIDGPLAEPRIREG